MSKKTKRVVYQNLDEKHDRVLCVLDSIATRTIDIISLNHINKILVYTNEVAKQIPYSRAANTYRMLVHAQHNMEIIKICTLWDSPSPDRNSLRTLAELSEGKDYREFVYRKTLQDWGKLPLPDDQEEATKQARIARLNLYFARRAVKRIAECDRFRSIIDMRDRNIAHSLTQNAKRRAPDRNMKYGDEVWLLNETIKIVDLFNLSIRGVSFDWDESKRIAEQNAHLFWDGVEIKVKG